MYWFAEFLLLPVNNNNEKHLCQVFEESKDEMKILCVLFSSLQNQFSLTERKNLGVAWIFCRLWGKTWVQFPAVLENFGLVVFLSLPPFQITNGRYSPPFGD